MSKIISVVPNISEARNPAVIDRMVESLKQIPNLKILDISRDQTRNRTVISFCGSKEAIFQGGLALYRNAVDLIDMRQHQGQYPRIGALDVFPFVPLKDATIEDAVAWSVEFAEKVAAEFNIPVYLFSESARYPTRRELDNIREGEFEGLAVKMSDPRWQADFGPGTMHSTFGATIIGARYPLISFKAHFDSDDIDAVKKVDDSLNSLKHVAAHAGRNPETGKTQITVMISNFRATPMYRVMESLRLEARRFGVTVQKVELIGLIPEIAIIDSALYYLGIRDFHPGQILEKRILAQLNEQFMLE